MTHSCQADVNIQTHFPFFEKVGSYPLPYASTSLRFAKLPTDTRGVLADRFAIASRACSDPASVVSSNCIYLVFHFLEKSNAGG